ncbi:MAG: hypothetical protein IJE68_06630 [Clostridia bacterium]|nr:hypothetical protein [Clostridia bacterium]
MFYKVNLDVTKDLSKQELKDETKAFIQIINEKYFSNLLKENKVNQSEKVEERVEVKQTTALAIIKKENKILRWLKNIFRKIID